MKWVGRVACAALLMAVWSVSPVRASVSVGFAYPSGQTVVLNNTIDVQIVATITPDTPIVGWGLDMGVDSPAIASVVPPPVIDAAWDAPLSNPDGDGLGGLAPTPPGTGLSGTVLLATITLSADAEGITGLTLSDNNPADLTEGFAVEPPPAGAFASVVYNGGSITVIPEPASFALLALGGLALLRRKP